MTPNNDPVLARTILGFAATVALLGGLAFAGAAYWAGATNGQIVFAAVLPPVAIAAFWRVGRKRS